MNLVTFDRIVLLLNQVPDIMALYEKRHPTFVSSVKCWMENMEKTLKNNRIQLTAEISTLKALITSAQRGVQNNDIGITIKAGHNSKRNLVDAISVHVLHQAQHSLQTLLNPYQEKYDEANQIARKILLMASSLGMLNARLRTTFDPSTLPSLWKEFISNETISPWTARMLEIVSFNEALIIINKILDEWIDDHKKNLVQ